MNHFGVAMGVMTVGVLGGAVLMDQHFKHDGKAVVATPPAAVAQSTTAPTSAAPAIDVATNDASMPAPASAHKTLPEKSAAREKTTTRRTETTVATPVAEQKAAKTTRSANATSRSARSTDGNAGSSVASTASAPSTAGTPDANAQ